MRRGVQFTPRRIERWTEAGRGTGTFDHYRAFHQVTRDDPSSRGRSRIFVWHRMGRQCHFLSDVEFVVFLCAHLLGDLVDCREQFPLSQLDGAHELSDYDSSLKPRAYIGTLGVAGQLGFKHPVIRGSGRLEFWPITTDLLVARGEEGRVRSLHAISVKRTVPTRRRTWELLALEERYWRSRAVPWQLITVEDFDGDVFRNLMMTASDALAEWRAPAVLMDRICDIATGLEGVQLGRAIRLASELARIPTNLAFHAFWQAVWSCRIRLDLRRPVRPGTPLTFVDEPTFRNFNPVARGMTS